jgi:hypothetical protein
MTEAKKIGLEQKPLTLNDICWRALAFQAATMSDGGCSFVFPKKKIAAYRRLCYATLKMTSERKIGSAGLCTGWLRDGSRAARDHRHCGRASLEVTL